MGGSVSRFRPPKIINFGLGVKPLTMSKSTLGYILKTCAKASLNFF